MCLRKKCNLLYMDNKKTEKIAEGIEVPKKEFCDRCGNDLIKGKWWIHYPFIKIYIVLCHVCMDGTKFGFYRDARRELKELE